MIPPPPKPAAIISGLTYALKMATLQAEPTALTPTTTAIWEALWLRFLLVLASGFLTADFNIFALLPLIIVIALVDTLSYPVASHFALNIAGLAPRFPLFILALSWIGNLRIIVLMTILLATGTIGVVGNGALLVAAIWIIWATWSVASRSLGGRGLAGAGMLVLMMVVEAINAAIIITILTPLIAQG